MRLLTIKNSQSVLPGRRKRQFRADHHPRLPLDGRRQRQLDTHQLGRQRHREYNNLIRSEGKLRRKISHRHGGGRGADVYGASGGVVKRRVLKRDLSRVGEHVVVGSLVDDEAWRAAIAHATSSGEIWVAQRFVPQRSLATPWGPRFLTLGAYVLDGSFVGYFARLSITSHCGHDALAVPVFVGEETS